MFLIERRLQILRYLERHETGTVRQLARLFSVSLETIRSDLRELADEGNRRIAEGNVTLPVVTLESLDDLEKALKA